MIQEFQELLLSELRMATYEPGLPEQGNDELLCAALTVNENLASLGYTLRPDDIVRLSVSGSLEGFFDRIKALVPDVKAEPMYPGFPEQVMELSEAEFRMHQMMHYFSTYGIESLTGMRVSKGWLPQVGGYTRDKYDATLLDSRVIELVPEQEAPHAVLETLLQRRERLTNPELALVLESARQCAPEQLKGLKIRFKENLDLLFPMLMRETDRQTAFETLKAICDHAGDVLRCGDDYLHQRHCHLKTREKKLLVKLLEAYPVRNLKDNLMLSNSARERNLLLLQYLDYNRFSRSAEHREAVRALRNGELLSWQAVAEKLLSEGKPEALQYLAGRPGYMVRMLNRLMTQGYTENAILSVLMPAAGKLSGHLIVKTAGTLAKRKALLAREHRQAIRECREQFEREKIKPQLNLWSIQLEVRQKTGEAREKWFDGPERKIREKAFEPLKTLTGRLKEMKQELADKRDLLTRNEAQKQSGNGRILLIRNAGRDWDPEVFAEDPVQDPEAAVRARIGRLNSEIACLEAEIREQRTRISATRSACRMEYQRLAAEMRERNTPAYEAALEACREYEKAETRKAEERLTKALAAHREAMKTLPARMKAALEQLEKRYQEMLLKAEHDEAVVRILTAVLKEHFRQAATPLRGRKVFPDLDEFDLNHSELETENRSKDGGYIRSGICFRIPENANTVRFFVYWNDEERVDVDLHASGLTTDGQPLHVGWNADYKKTGVVHSGDITHSDAAEYIDIDLSALIREIDTNVHLYSGRRAFREVETCYVGLMAVQRAGQDVKHYDPKNCFFTHRLTQNTRSLRYGCIDVQNRFIRFVGQPDTWTQWDSPEDRPVTPMFSLQDYLNCLLEGQGAVIVSDREEADIVLTMGKSSRENGLSLTDHNFFLES